MAAEPALPRCELRIRVGATSLQPCAEREPRHSPSCLGSSDVRVGRNCFATVPPSRLKLSAPHFWVIRLPGVSWNSPTATRQSSVPRPMHRLEPCSVRCTVPGAQPQPRLCHRTHQEHPLPAEMQAHGDGIPQAVRHPSSRGFAAVVVRM